jgi:chromosome segregation ATPase
MTDDLVNELRDAAFLGFDDGTRDYSIASEAADRIEALTAQLAEEKRMRQEEKAKILRQREQLDSIQKANRNNLPMTRGLQRRVAELEAELDRAIDDARDNAEYVDLVSRYRAERDECKRNAAHSEDVVRAARVEIERLRAQLAEDADVRKQIDHRLEELVGQVDALTARAEVAEKKLQEMQAHIDHADAYHKAMLAAEADNARLRENLADAALALDVAGMELSDFANCLSREAWAANNAYEAAISARAVLNPGKETK